MQMIMQAALLGALCLSGATAAGTSPISKVTELLSGLAAEITKEGEEAAKLSAEKATWCKDTSTNLGFEIKTGTSSIEDLEAKITKEAATISGLGEKIEELAAGIAKDDKDLKAATKIRAEEVGDFEAEEKELTETIEVLQRAINVLEKELAKGGAALVQTQGASNVVQAMEALVKASGFSTADADRLTAFVQSTHQDSDAGAPDAAAYESKAGGIVEVLEDLLDKANAKLSDTRSKEGKAQQNFELLKQSLEDSMTHSTADMEEAKKATAKAGEEKSGAEGELASTSKDLAEDKAMLAEVTKECAAYVEEYEAEQKSRAEELAVVKKAMAILEESTGDAADVQYALPQASAAPSFLQLGRRGVTHEQASTRAIRYVRGLARKSNSKALMQLASHMASAARLGAAGGEDPFVKVKGLITEMISKLEAEQSEEAEQKAYCDKEMKDANAKKSEKVDLVEKLTTKIEQMSAKSEKLKDSVATLQAELAELAETQKEMDKLRKEESALFKEQSKALKDGIVGVEKAMKVLKDYYAEDGTKSGAAGGIIGMLEVCLADFTKTLAEITSGEDSAQSEYEVTTQDNKEATVAKTQDVKYQTKEAAGLDKAVSETSADMATTQSELDAVNEYLTKLEDMCIAKPETYEERASRRATEIAGLKKALEILA